MEVFKKSFFGRIVATSIVLFVFDLGLVSAASLGQEWKYVGTGQFKNDTEFTCYYNKEKVDYNQGTGVIESRVAFKYQNTTDADRKIRTIYFMNVDFDTNEHKKRIFGRRCEIDDKDLNFSDSTLKSILNFGRYASTLLVPFDGGFTAAFINGFTTVAGEDTTVSTMSHFLNPSYNNKADPREENKFSDISTDEKAIFNKVYKAVRADVGLNPNWTTPAKSFFEW